MSLNSKSPPKYGADTTGQSFGQRVASSPGAAQGGFFQLPQQMEQGQQGFGQRVASSPGAAQGGFFQLPQQMEQGQPPQGQPPQGQPPQGMAGLRQAMATRMMGQSPQGMAGFGALAARLMGRQPQGQPPPPGGPPPGGPPSSQPPISPEGWGAYRQLGTMPITGKQSSRAYDTAAKQFINQHGAGYDPNNTLQRSKALRKYTRGR